MSTKILGQTPEPLHVTAQMLLTIFTDSVLLSEMGTVHQSPTHTFNKCREENGANVCRWTTDSSKMLTPANANHFAGSNVKSLLALFPPAQAYINILSL